MKKQLSRLLLLVVALFTFGCLPQGIEPTLVLTPDAPITYETQGGTSFVDVETNLPKWDVESSDKSWCTVEKLSSGRSFSITASKNLEKNTRTAIVTVTGIVGTQGKLINIVVTQTGIGLDPFVIALTDITVSGAKFDITPADKKMRYYTEVITKDSITTKYRGELSRYMVAVIANALKKTNDNVEDALNLISSVGDKSTIYDTLLPDEEYLAFAIGLSDECEVLTRAVYAGFKTLVPKPQVITEVE